MANLVINFPSVTVNNIKTNDQNNPLKKSRNMKNIPYVLAVQSMVGVLLCASACAQPYTDASVSVNVAVVGPLSRSDPHSASLFAYMDFSSGFVNWSATAQANTTYGVNSAYTDLWYAYIPGEIPPTVEPATTASYSLNWSTTDNSQSGTLISVEAGPGDTVNDLYTGVLSFLYGTPYNIESLLAINASYAGTAATASSTWADTITFLGQPDGTTGEATFTVSLVGSISFQTSQPTYGTEDGPLVFDRSDVVGGFGGGAGLSSIELPFGTSIEAASGTVYPVSQPVPLTFVPEPGTISLFGLGLVGFWLRWFKPKRRPAFQALDSRSRR